MTSDRQTLMREQLQRLRSENLELRQRLNARKRDANTFERAIRNEQRLLSEIPAPFAIIQDEKVVFANECAASALGYSPSDVVGRSFFEFVRPDLVGYVKGLHRRRLVGRPVPDQYETFMVSRQGESHCFQVRVEKTRYHGRKAFAVALLPLDEWKENERIHCLVRKQEALGRMAIGFCRQIASMAGLILEGERALGAPELAKNTPLDGPRNKVGEAAERLHSLAGRLSGLSDIPYDRSSLTPFDLKKMVQDVVGAIRQRLGEDKAAGEPALRIKTYLRSLSPVEGRMEEIRDALYAIILNSVEALPEGGDIYVTTEEEAGYANVYVQDNGKGIPAEIQDKIFDPFFTTKEEGREGLGLSLSRAAVYRHGGEIDLRSREGEGTTLLLRLPLPSEPQRPGRKRAGKQVKDSRVIILALDYAAGSLLSELFSGKGGKVTLLSTAAECVRMLGKSKADLVIVDGEIREAGFVRFMERFRAENRAVPIAVIAPQEQEDGPPSSPSLAGDFVIGRPLDLDQVLRQVKDALAVRGEGSRRGP